MERQGNGGKFLHRHPAALNNPIPSIDPAHSFRACTAQVSDLLANNWVNQLLTNGGTAEDWNSLAVSSFSYLTYRWKISLLCPFWKSGVLRRASLFLVRKAKKSLPPHAVGSTPLLPHAACFLSYTAIFISSLQPSCCFMLAWRTVWQSQQRRVNPRGTCLLSLLEQMKCHVLHWGVE